jgi:glycosyltransferase involved in cell wall biosynthesis
MSKLRTPVIAVIPAHNSTKTIRPLLDELIKQKYDQIFVIDDASTDSTTQVVRSYKNKVQLIQGTENVGSGANRNRIIGKIPKSIIHFIDADMNLLSKKTPEIIRDIKWPMDLAFIGGMVRNPDGTQNPFNYGMRPHLLASIIIGGLQYLIWLIGRANKPTGRFLRKFFQPLLHRFPEIYETPKSRRVYWVAESNMIIKSDLFERHGGYDPRFRYSEIEDFALRTYRSGLHGRFDPRIDAMHASNDNILKSGKKRVKARKEFNKKHGRLVYLIPPLSDYFAGRKTQKRYHK